MIRFNVGQTDTVGMTVGKAKEVAGSGSAVDLSNYYTKIETDEAISKAIEKVELLPGPPGPAYTLTDADKAEIVDSVLDSLPAAEGGSF